MRNPVPLALLFMTAVALSSACAGRRATAVDDTPAPEPARSVATAPAPASPNVVFSRTVQPVLARTCAPCHEPGGKMYDRLPFDDPAVVRANREGVLRRLKVTADREAVERWLAALDETG